MTQQMNEDNIIVVNKKNTVIIDDKKNKIEEVFDPIPPDGGWGWVVVFASLMGYFISDGVTNSLGVLNDTIMEKFNASDAAAGWVISILVGTTLSSGVIGSFLIDKFGCRTVAISGSILASLSMFLSVYAKSIIVLYMTIGIGAGVGFGFVNLSAVLSVTVYFEKRRSLATGIAVCGSGIGTMIVSPVLSKILNNYDFDTCLYSLSGFILFGILCGLIFIPVEPSLSQDDVVHGTAGHRMSIDVKIDFENQGKNNRNDNPPDYSEVIAKDNQSLSSRVSQTSLNGEQTFTRSSCGTGIMNRSDAFLRSSISRRKPSEAISTINTDDSNRNVEIELSTYNLSINNSQIALQVNESQEFNKNDNIISKMLQLNLLKDPLFVIFSVSNLFASIGYNVPFIHIESLAKRTLDLSDASALLSMVGIASTIARVVFGYLSDKTWINRIMYYNTCLTVGGIATLLIWFCNSYNLFVIYSLIFGFTSGAYIGLTSICLVDLVGLDRLTNAFGLLLLFQGTGAFIGPPIAGFLNGCYSNSKYPGMIFAGSMFAASGIMLYSVPVLQKKAKKKNGSL